MTFFKTKNHEFKGWQMSVHFNVMQWSDKIAIFSDWCIMNIRTQYTNTKVRNIDVFKRSFVHINICGF